MKTATAGRRVGGCLRLQCRVSPVCREDPLSAAEPTPDGLSQDAETTRQRRPQCMAGRSGTARARRQRLAAMCISLSGALLIGQAAAIAWLVQQVLVERAAGPGLPVLAGLAVILVLRTLLGSATGGRRRCGRCRAAGPA